MNYLYTKNEIVSILNMVDDIGRIYISYKQNADLESVVVNNTKNGVYCVCYVNRLSVSETDESGLGVRDEQDIALVKEIVETWGISIYYAYKDSNSSPSEIYFQQLIDRVSRAFRWLNSFSEYTYKVYSINFINTNGYEMLNNVLCHRADGRLTIKYRVIGDDNIYDVGQKVYMPMVLLFRRGTNQVTPNGVMIEFDDVGDDDYDVLVSSCKNANGESVGVETYGFTSNYFYAKSVENAEIKWVLLKQYDIRGYFPGIYRSGRISLQVNVWTKVEFNDCGTSDYDILVQECIGENGESVAVEFGEKGSNYFYCRALENCNLKWIIIKLNV